MKNTEHSQKETNSPVILNVFLQINIGGFAIGSSHLFCATGSINYYVGCKQRQT